MVASPLLGQKFLLLDIREFSLINIFKNIIEYANKSFQRSSLGLDDWKPLPEIWNCQSRRLISIDFFLINLIFKTLLNAQNICHDYQSNHQTDFRILVFKTKAGQIGITNLQLINYQYLESLVFLQAVLIYYFLTVSFW